MRILPIIRQIPLTPAKAGVAEPVLIEPSAARGGLVEVVASVGLVGRPSVELGVTKGVGVTP